VEKLQENTKKNGKYNFNGTLKPNSMGLWVVVKRNAQTWGLKALVGIVF
jgi:hypothetical protein